MQPAVSAGKQPVSGDQRRKRVIAVGAGNHETPGKRGKTCKQQQGQENMGRLLLFHIGQSPATSFCERVDKVSENKFTYTLTWIIDVVFWVL